MFLVAGPSSRLTRSNPFSTKLDQATPRLSGLTGQQARPAAMTPLASTEMRAEGPQHPPFLPPGGEMQHLQGNSSSSRLARATDTRVTIGATGLLPIQNQLCLARITSVNQARITIQGLSKKHGLLDTAASSLLRSSFNSVTVPYQPFTCLGRKPVPPTLTPPSVKATSQKQTAHPSSHVFPRREDWRKAAKQEYGTTTTGQSERRKCKEALLRQALTWRTAPSEKYLKYLLRFDDALDRAPKREMALAEVERDWVRYEVYVAERTLRDDRMPTTIYGTEDRFELDLLKLWVNTNQHRIPSRRPWPPDYQPRHLWSRRRDTMNAESSVALDSMYTSDVRETEAVDARSGLLSWFFG
ncbi:MAG: hypothetical protein LQ345_007211 [Seirophora villosa]|nr:MAG: hypothetical protein LQ345_007211 [Seirophora villosa]